ncbi:hypothetical protein IMZ48_31755, partial [Candidatus Bathyarchaeota archaeon]|nr:hypothetical protein [Candidatus Bathyarchaeota archaeon]
MGAKVGAVASSSAPTAQQPRSTPASPNVARHSSATAQRPPNGFLPPLQPPPPVELPGNPALVSPVESDASCDDDDVFAPQGGKVSAPANGKFKAWAPALGSSLADGERSGDTAGVAVHGGAGATGDVKDDDKSDDWVGVSPQQLSEQVEAGEAGATKQGAASKDEEVSGTAVVGKETADKSGPTRPLSFAGLPALRRSSTFEPAFGVKAKDAVDEGGSDDEDQGVRLAQEGHVVKLPTIADVRTPTPPLESPAKDVGDAKPLEGQTPGDDVKGDGATAPAPANDKPAVDQQSALPAPGPGLGRNLPEHMKKNPIQKPPPHGQWNLQESYLAEPLISPSRKRPTSPSSQAESFTELDKETGAGGSTNTRESSDAGSSSNKISQDAARRAAQQPRGSGEGCLAGEPQTERVQSSSAVNAAPAGASTDERGPPLPPRPDEQGPALPPRPRAGPKFGITPPVSMQRYRGLFAPKQPPAVYGQPGQPPPSQSHPNLAESSGALPDSSAQPRPRSSSRPPTADGGRRSSGIFT